MYVGVHLLARDRAAAAHRRAADSDALLLCAAGTAAAGGLCCSICYKTFKARDSFRQHLALHKGRTVCALCGRVFSTLTNLYKHQRQKHGGPGGSAPLPLQPTPQP